MKGGLFLLLAAVLFVLYFTGLSSYGLTEPDEPRYAESAREMLEMKSYITPYYNYRPRWEKPPLYYWMEMVSYRVFGVSEGSARIPSVVMAFMCAAFLFLVVSKCEGASYGIKAPLAFLSMPFVFVISHLSITDMTLCFFITLASYSLFLFLEGWGGFWRTVAYISMALGVLTKGPVAFVIPIPSAVLYLVWKREFRRISSLFPLGGIAIFLAISLPWFLHLYRAVGPEFFYRQTIGRFFKGVAHKEPFYFFIPYVAGGALPQLLMVLRPRSGMGKDLLVKFSLILFLYTFFFFSASKGKLPNYILPVFPPLAVMVSSLSKDEIFSMLVTVCVVLYLSVKFFFLPAQASRLSIRPLFKGRSFEKGASFLYYRRPYKAYPFYVRSRVWRIEDPEEAFSFSKPAYVLVKGEFLKRFSDPRFKVVSRSVFRKKEIFLIKVEGLSPP